MKLTQSVIIFIALSTVTQPVFAYLDPGTGSLALQMLIAGIMGALFTIKTYWQWLKNSIARLFGKKIVNPVEETVEEGPVKKSTHN